MKLRCARLALVVLVGILVGSGGVPDRASAFPMLGLGLDDSDACLDGEPSCVTNATFSLDPPGAKTTTGSVDIAGGFATISAFVPSYTMTPTGAPGTVTSLIFSNVTYSAVVPVSVTAFPGFFQATQIPGLATGSVSGTYEQVGLAGPVGFGDLEVSFSDLNCLLVDGFGQCGFFVGAISTADFALPIDGADHDVVQSFNVIVPEPATASLLACGLLALALRRRR